MFKRNQLLTIRDDAFDAFMETDYEESRDYYRRTNKWVFRYEEDNGQLVVWHSDGDDTEYWLKPEWVELIDGETGEVLDFEEARIPQPLR